MKKGNNSHLMLAVLILLIAFFSSGAFTGNITYYTQHGALYPQGPGVGNMNVQGRSKNNIAPFSSNHPFAGPDRPTVNNQIEGKGDIDLDGVPYTREDAILAQQFLTNHNAEPHGREIRWQDIANQDKFSWTKTRDISREQFVQLDMNEDEILDMGDLKVLLEQINPLTNPTSGRIQNAANLGRFTHRNQLFQMSGDCTELGETSCRPENQIFVCKERAVGALKWRYDSVCPSGTRCVQGADGARCLESVARSPELSADHRLLTRSSSSYFPF